MQKPDHKIFKADRKLQAKAGTGEIDRRAIERAEEFVKNNKIIYADITLPIMKQLRSSIEQLKADPSTKVECSRKIRTAVMDLKASAATFHYPLISRLCKPLLQHLETCERIDKETITITELLYHLITIILKNKESELDPALARDLEKTFIIACNKISGKSARKRGG